MKEDTGARPPWYREPLVWLVIAFPLAAVVGGFATLYLAIRSWDGLVVDDYYKQGLEINKLLARDELAQQAGYTASVAVADGQVTVHLASTHGSPLPPIIKVSFIHATRAGLDKTLEIPQTGGGVYVAPVGALPAGHWHVHIEAAEWRLIEQLVRRTGSAGTALRQAGTRPGRPFPRRHAAYGRVRESQARQAGLGARSMVLPVRCRPVPGARTGQGRRRPAAPRARRSHRCGLPGPPPESRASAR